MDCSGECFGSSVFDECGVCGGYGESCSAFGDVNDDGVLNIQDVIVIVNWVMDGVYDISADVNNDSNIDVLDILIIVNRIINIWS